MPLDGWSYCSPVTIRHAGATDLLDYQIAIWVNTSSLIAEGKLRSDGGDIRVVDSDDNTVLTYWLDTATINRDRTRIWAKIPSIPVGCKTIFLYYGNASATSLASGADTFLLFDDFDGSAIDTSKWTIADSTGWSVASGELTGTSTTGRLQSVSSFTAPIACAAKIKAVTKPSTEMMLAGFWASTADHYGIGIKTTGENLYANGTLSSLGDIIPSDMWMIAHVKTGATNQAEVEIETDLGTAPHTVPYANAISSEKVTLGKAYTDSGTGNACDIRWDWLHVRKMIEPEPVVVPVYHVVDSAKIAHTLTAHTQHTLAQSARISPYTGNGTLTGRVFTNGSITPFAEVFLYEVSGALVDKTTADSLGRYTFTGIDMGRQYVTLSHQVAYNAAVADWLTPTA